MKQKGLAPILIVLLIAAAIGGYLIYAGKINLNKPTPQQTIQPSTTSDASPAPTGAVETANWKTYTNKEYRIQFKYPADLSFEELPITMQTRKFLTIMIDRYGDNVLSMRMEEIPIGNAEQDRYYMYLNLTPQERIINDYKWKEYLVRPEDYPKGAGLVPQWPNLHLDTDYGGFVYIVSTFKKTSFSEIQNQIISTIRFIQ
ncbi:MAG: hypothetical protein Q8P92_05535 [Candidatus Daviesbacteria bacterium]|nr:hypothetical protein [Candidatus Daviesbacteria bacterium]